MPPNLMTFGWIQRTLIQLTLSHSLGNLTLFQGLLYSAHHEREISGLGPGVACFMSAFSKANIQAISRENPFLLYHKCTLTK